MSLSYFCSPHQTSIFNKLNIPYFTSPSVNNTSTYLLHMNMTSSIVWISNNRVWTLVTNQKIHYHVAEDEGCITETFTAH